MIIDKIGEGHYQTRSGLPVVIEAKNGMGAYSVRGYVIESDGTEEYNTWTKHGDFYADTNTHDLDLIPVAQAEAQPLPESETGYKIDLSEASEEERREAQELAFELGYVWKLGGANTKVSFLDYPFYFLKPDSRLKYVPKDSKDYFDMQDELQITLHDLRAAVAHRKQQEADQPEPKQERPVDVGIPYTNETERKAAIKQAESYGYKEWDGNKRHRSETDNYIWLHKDGDWFDAKLDEGNKTIPLDRSFMEQPEVKQPKYFDIPGHGKVFNHLIENYSMVEQNDGTITLTPIDKEYQANYEKALQFLDKTPENVMWPHSDLAKILVEFLNSVK